MEKDWFGFPLNFYYIIENKTWQIKSILMRTRTKAEKRKVV